MRTLRKCIVFILVCLTMVRWTAKAQDSIVSPLSLTEDTESVSLSSQETDPLSVQESDPSVLIGEEELNQVGDIRSQFERQNNVYSAPVKPSEGILRFINKDKLEMSPEVKVLIDKVEEALNNYDNNVSMDIIKYTPSLSLPLVYRGSMVPIDGLYTCVNDYKEKNLLDTIMPKSEPDPYLVEFKKKRDWENEVYKKISYYNPGLFAYTQEELREQAIIPEVLETDVKEVQTVLPQIPKKEVPLENPDELPRFIPDRLYWKSAFQSSVQFSQSHISENWFQGGVGNINVFTRNYMSYNYAKNKVALDNEAELKLSIISAPKDTIRGYSLGENSIRLRSNLRIKAFKKWDYSVNAQLTSMLFDNYIENQKTLFATFGSPITFTLGVGMKYSLHKAFPSNKYRSVTWSLNLDPLSYTHMHSIKTENIDLGRYGFKRDPETNQFINDFKLYGSTVRSALVVKFNKNVTLNSITNYNTSYERVILDFENTLDLAISRFFSTRIYLYIRYDDGVAVKNPKLGYFQIKEMLTFGFSYNW